MSRSRKPVSQVVPPAVSHESGAWRAILLGAPLGTRVSGALVLFLLLVYGGLMLRGAWVCDDAYITFRFVEQLFAGNGPVWNAGVRVLSYTHPLWFGVLSAGRLISRDLFAVAIAASTVFSLAAVFFLLVRFGGKSLPRLLFLAAAVMTSQAFVDFSTSGLENSLLNLLLVWFLATYLGPGDAYHRLVRMVFGASLMMLCRHDSATIWFPALAVVMVDYVRHVPAGQTRITGALWAAASPVLVWTAFSLFYYGFPVPNTAYAKLGTGIASGDLLRQGFYYVLNGLRWDPVTLLSIFAGMVLPWLVQDRRLWWLSAGLVLNFIYVLRAGGDFMAGRFWVSAFVVALVVVALGIRKTAFHWVAVAAVLGCLVANAEAPPRFNPWKLTYNRIDDHGIADEKSFYFGSNSFLAWLYRDPWLLFPRHPWVDEGAQFRLNDERVAYIGNIGMYGYFAGTQKIIVDGLALTDPFLARLPAVKVWRVGHYPRVLPDGYLDSVKAGRNLVKDPELAHLYDQIILVTQGPLLSWPRAAAIWELNTGISSRP